MFKRRKSVQVLKVKHEQRTITEITKTGDYRYSSTFEKESKEVNITIVLCVVDGELVTREFNGSWSLDDVKKWEEL